MASETLKARYLDERVYIIIIHALVVILSH